MSSKEYKYKIGEIVNGLEILKQIRSPSKNKNGDKAYQYKCIVDGYIGEKTETSMYKGHGCPVCSKKVTKKGINDIATTNPELIKYFVDINDTFKYASHSGKKAICKCPICGEKKNININQLSRKGFSCPKCGDGISYPNKFMFNILKQLNVKFETEKSFDWSTYKVYDFFVQNIGIIEMFGKQHYDEEFIRIKSKNRRGKTLQEEQENDELKEHLAKENGIHHYIVIDCKYSELEYIKNSIENSEFVKLFDLSNIDWLKCHEYACNSLVKVACDLWNNYEDMIVISKKMKLHRDTVRKYLKQGVVLDWCTYDAKSEMKKSALATARKRKGIQLEVYDLNKNLLIKFNSMKNIEKESEKLLGVKFNAKTIRGIKTEGKYKGFYLKKNKIKS